MARTSLNTISVYATNAQLAHMKRAAAKEGRPLSNYMLWAGSHYAVENLGVKPHGVDGPGAPGHDEG